jgi:arsenate reductase-like glutaredoxin family protein
MDIGHLITFIVSFFTILLFRRIDKNKLQINKLKKFFEQTQQNFVSLAESKDQHFKDNTIELDMLIEKSADLMLLKT